MEPSKADINNKNAPTKDPRPGRLPGQTTSTDRPFAEVLNQDSGRLARKLLAHPEVLCGTPDETSALINGLVKLSRWKA